MTRFYLPCGPKKRTPWFILTITSVIWTDFNNFFTVTTKNLRRTKIKLFPPPHLYCVATLPSETNTDAGINANFSGSCSKTNYYVFQWLKYLFTYLQQCFIMSLLRHYCVCV